MVDALTLSCRGLGDLFCQAFHHLTSTQATATIFGLWFTPIPYLSIVKVHEEDMCVQIFVTDRGGHNRVYPMSSKGLAYDKLDTTYGSTAALPKAIITVNAGEETGSEWDHIHKKNLFQQRMTKAYSP